LGLSDVLLFAAGLALLAAGAEALVRGASRLAVSVGISPLVVGLTVVAFGTSAPEMAVTVSAALEGRADVAVGNAVGSNILNVLLILGLAALVTPLSVNLQVVRQEVPIMIGVSLVFAVLVADGALARAEGLLLVALLAAYVVFLVWQSRNAGAGPAERRRTSRWDRHWVVQAALVALGLALLVIGARWLVDAAVAFAQAIGVSDLVIGLTVVALGTSLPEAATSLAAVLRGERDIAVGNVVGSNVFNILGCLGVAGAIASGGLPVAAAVLNFDLWVMVAVALACLPVFFTGCRIGRTEGALLLAYGCGYVAYLVLDAQGHDALQPFSAAMMSFVIPLTIVALLAVVLRSAAPGRRRARVEPPERDLPCD
jgi:cation:H+ antiporter